MVKYSIPDKQVRRSFLWCVLAYITAYLYGSLPLLYFLGRQSGENLKQSGSGNVGAANLLAEGGAKRAVIGGLFDTSKGCLPILACRQLGYPAEVAEFAGVCGVVGQCWPIFLRFNGGRGLSAFIGASFLVNRRGWVISVLPMIGGALWRILSSFSSPLRKPGNWLKNTHSKSVPLGCLLGTLAFPFVCYLDQHQERKRQLAPLLLPLIIVGRRLTAPLPDDTMHGPGRNKKALLYRLLYDRNTSDPIAENSSL
jgi:acyl-phosphate glycerol 3-phosphate acyltransferase